MRRLVITAIVGLFILGCATASSTAGGTAKSTFAPAAESDRSAVFPDATSDSAFEAVKSAYFDLNIDITAGSKESGYLNGREKLDSAVATSLFPGTRATYNNYNCVVLTQSDNSIRIKIKITNASEEGTSPREASHETYARFWEKVNEVLAQ